MEKNIDFIYDSDLNDYHFIYVVDKGKNNEKLGYDGISHLIEHIILILLEEKEYKAILRGRTGFYYCLYNWTTYSYEEGIKILNEINQIIEKIKTNELNFDKQLEKAKKEVIEECINYSKKKLSVKKIVKSIKGKNYTGFPVGNVINISKINQKDIVDFIKNNYTDISVAIISSDENISYNSFDVEVDKIDTYKEDIVNINDGININIENINFIGNKITLLIKSKISQTFLESILEMFIMTYLCIGLSKNLDDLITIEYEKLILGKNEKYLLIYLGSKNAMKFLVNNKRINNECIFSHIFNRKNFDITKKAILNIYKCENQIREFDERYLKDICNLLTINEHEYYIINNTSRLVRVLQQLTYEKVMMIIFQIIKLNYEMKVYD